MDDILRKLQLTQLEMLKYVDTICKNNDIKYSLYAGTLLGAVRHKGFIPWDDDLDICMPREDYNRFLNVWDTINHEGYLLQNKDNTPSFTQSFTKIRKDNTAFVQEAWEVGKYHTGIFIDIFPIDRIPNHRFQRLLFYWRCMQYQLYTREFAPEGKGRMVKLGSTLLLRAIPVSKRKQRRKALLARITAQNNNHNACTVGIEVVRSMKAPLPPELIDDWTELQFEDASFSCFAMWHEFLTIKYGNYLQYPPKEEQVWRHHPIALNFEHNYGDS